MLAKSMAMAVCAAIVLWALLACGGEVETTASPATGEGSPRVLAVIESLDPSGEGVAATGGRPATPAGSEGAEASGGREGAGTLVQAELGEAQAALEDLRGAIAAGEAALERARRALAGAEERLAALEVGEFDEGDRVSDAVIFRTVQRRLLEAPALSHVALAAEVDAGAVTLRGVADAATARLAEEMVVTVDGVLSVENAIEIAP